MTRFLLILLIFAKTICFGQLISPTDSLLAEFQNTAEKSKRLMDSATNPTKYAKTLNDFLSLTFSEKSTKDGRWVYYENEANLKQIEKPQIEKLFPDSKLYSVRLTNYLVWHINQGTCIILFDSLNSKITLAQPLWYRGISMPLVKNFIGHKFANRDSLRSFLKELNELMETGSSYRFKQTSYNDSLITYDLGYFKGDNYTTGGNGIKSTINYNEDDVWRKIRIDIKYCTITRYTSINPRIKSDREIIE